MEQAMVQMRHKHQDVQVAMQQQQAVLIQQQAQVTDATARAPSADMERIAAKLAARADDGDIIDNKALANP